MSNWKVGPGGRLYHPTTGAYVGQLDENGNEQMVLTATPSSGGLAIEDGSDKRAFVTVGMEGGVPTGNFTQLSPAGSYP